MNFETEYMPIFMETVEKSWPSTIKKTRDLNANLIDLGLDSLDVSALILSVEERFSIAVSDEELEEIDSINDISKLVFKKLF
jgi:acyl carrier protein